MRRVLVAAGSSPVRGDFSDVPVHRVNPEAWGVAVDSPKVKPGCAVTALALLACSSAIVFGAAYVAFSVARAVWS
jgi:hypothetical protein